MEVHELRAQIAQAFGIDPTHATSFVLEMESGSNPPTLTVQYHVVGSPDLEVLEQTYELVPVEEEEHQ